VSLDDLDDGRARRADRVACGAIQDAVGLDRVAPVDVAATGAVAFNPTEWYAFSDHSPIVATFED